MDYYCWLTPNPANFQESFKQIPLNVVLCFIKLICFHMDVNFLLKKQDVSGLPSVGKYHIYIHEFFHLILQQN